MLIVVAVAVLLIVGPLRLGGSSSARPDESPELAELEAAKEAKYRDIRETELDFRTGKLSGEDWRRLDSTLRAEAIEILRRLDALEGRQSDKRKTPPR